jgi:hypothetical protein
MRPRVIAALVIATVLGTASGVLILTGGIGSADKAPRVVSEHPVAVPAAARTVLVSRSMPAPSAHARRLSAMLEEGAMPDGPLTAEVMTDTECTPDARMTSHCRNVMRLADGRQIVLRHAHEMSKVPCLAPGERVRLIPSAA